MLSLSDGSVCVLLSLTEYHDIAPASSQLDVYSPKHKYVIIVLVDALFSSAPNISSGIFRKPHGLQVIQRTIINIGIQLQRQISAARGRGINRRNAEMQKCIKYTTNWLLED